MAPSPGRRAIVVFGHLCSITSAYLFARVPMLVVFALFTAGILLVWAGHGRLRALELARWERIVFLGGSLALLAAFCPFHYWQAARSSAWLPRQPALLWFAVCGAVLDLSRPHHNRHAQQATVTIEQRFNG